MFIVFFNLETVLSYDKGSFIAFALRDFKNTLLKPVSPCKSILTRKDRTQYNNGYNFFQNDYEFTLLR
jgi:hypothetical protein